MLSDHSKKMLKNTRENPSCSSYKSKKLLATLKNKKKYTVHYMNLKFYLEMGLRLKKIHCVISFKQERVLAKYIDYCTEKRASSSSEFQKTRYKLQANAIFGKTCEQVRKHLSCKFVRSAKQTLQSTSDPLFECMKFIDNDFGISFHKLSTVKMDKPFLIGFTILERSKEFMVRSYYEKIKPKFPRNYCSVLFSDTDSLCLKVIVQKFEDPIVKLKEIMDFSNYPKSHYLHNSNNKNQLGFFKDELKGKKLKAFAGIRSKCYSLLYDDEMKTCDNTIKGVKKGCKKKITFKDFTNCIKKMTPEFRVTQYHLRSENHIVNLMKIDKRAFSSFDDKVFQLNCNIHSLPYGHYKISESNGQPICEICGI